MIPLPAFFFDTAGAEKVASQSEAAEQRRNAEKVSLAATSDKGAAGCLLDAEFFKIQHQVASLTLESITTFTRHNAFLEKRSIKTLEKAAALGASV